MSTQTVESIQRLAPYLEGLEKRLMQTAFGKFSGSKQTKPGILDKPLGLPQYEVAGLDPLQQMALDAAPSMVGSYTPFTMGAGMQSLAGAGALQQGLGMLNPMVGASMFMNPYQGFVIDEINRQADIAGQKDAAQAVQRGAFGGSRYGVQEAEREGRRLAAIGEAQRKGFQDAITSSQKAGQLMGGLGQAYGQLAGTTADIGRVQSELGRADLGMLTQLGDIGRTYDQQLLEAQRQNQLQTAQEPFTRLEIGQSLLKGLPSSSLSGTFKSVTTPDANPFLSGVGAYTALQGIKPTGAASL
mgnify:CR=1 FL=1|tara:strand:+ start:1501 stop:2400 length:900 start_codon:yes stop_codon:yes gene_type:complete